MAGHAGGFVDLLASLELQAGIVTLLCVQGRTEYQEAENESYIPVDRAQSGGFQPGAKISAQR